MNKNTIKKVNVYPRRPIFFGNKEIRHDELGIQLAVGDIFQCLLALAKVEEVLGSGQTKELLLSDFYGQNWTQTEDEEVVKISPANGSGETLYTTKSTNTTSSATTTAEDTVKPSSTDTSKNASTNTTSTAKTTTNNTTAKTASTTTTTDKK